jgi:hypothetical protein
MLAAPFLMSLLAAANAGAPARAPVFADFLVAEAAPAAPVQADLASHPDARRYRTLLRQSKRDSNFAGHFTAITIGCGSSCALLALVDRKTGRVFFPPEFGPMEWGVADQQDYGFSFKVNSRLVRACGDPAESGKSACRFYEWSGTSVRLVGQVPWGAVESGVAADGAARRR